MIKLGGIRRVCLLLVLGTGSVTGPCFRLCPADARPLYAARTGMACARCHIDPAGGGERTSTGFIYAFNGHTMIPAEERTATIQPRVGEGLQFGGDFRTQYQQDLRNELRHRSTFYMMQSSFYVSAELNERLSLCYANDQGTTLEAFGLISGLPFGGSLKVGKFHPAYGIEEEDHTIFTRDSLGFGHSSEDTGVELSLAHGPRYLTIAVINGNRGVIDNNAQKGIVGRAWCYNDHVGLGLSGFMDNTDPARGAADRVYRYGIFGNLHHGPLVLLGEYDRGKTDPTRGPAVEAEAGFTELSCRVTDRLTAKLDYDRFDPNLEYAETARDRIGIGFEADLMPFARLLTLARGTRQYGHDAYGRRHYGGNRDTYDALAQIHLSF